jgi:hypothetical protein
VAAPEDLDLIKWNEMVGAFHSESDRGAAILAGSFVENYLGLFLRHKAHDERVADQLFGAMGPLATFSQRIAVAYAFGLVKQAEYSDLELIRKIRNYFAHHPLHGTFDASEVKNRASHLSTFQDEGRENDPKRNRHAYLIACGGLCAKFEIAMYGYERINGAKK